MKKTRLAAALGVVLSASMVLAGCGASNQAADTSDDGKVMTVDLYDQLASGQSGLMKGWFAKLMLKKFNIKINIISPSASGGGDQLFETRSAAGNVGDIIIVDNNKLRKPAKAGLVSDMTPYLKGMDNLNKFKPAAKALSKGIGKSEGIWGYQSRFHPIHQPSPLLSLIQIMRHIFVGITTVRSAIRGLRILMTMLLF